MIFFVTVVTRTVESIVGIRVPTRTYCLVSLEDMYPHLSSFILTLETRH